MQVIPKFLQKLVAQQHTTALLPDDLNDSAAKIQENFA